MTKIKPCPFCGAKKAYTNGNDVAGVCWVTCGGCGTMKGISKTTKEAIEAWNTRTRKGDQ